MALGGLADFLALDMINAAYMIAIKRLSILFAILAGGWLFREQNMAARLSGGALMAAGAVLMSLYG